MARKHNFAYLSFLLIPIMHFTSPDLFSLMGIQPYWPLLLLLPLVSKKKSSIGLFLGLLLGVFLDSLNESPYTQVPGLAVAGLWFGKINNYNQKSIEPMQYGLFACLASFICGLLYFLQIFYKHFGDTSPYLIPYGIKIILIKVVLTGLFAPLLCPWLDHWFNVGYSNNKFNR
mgnify:CR=1 FL=1|tara:strand:- start:1291 stop:1809 length:519 start_codon:yes stop_codon:yes gene_type:complete